MSTRGKVPNGFDDIHRILGGAMRAAPPDAWPKRPHLGGPLPALSTNSQVKLASLIGDRARSLAGNERDAVDRMLSLVDAIYALDTSGWTKKSQEQKKAFDKTSASAKSDTPVMKAAKLVVRAAYNDRWASPAAQNIAGTLVERAAVVTVTELANRLGDVRGFLAELDAGIVRHELGILLGKRAIEPTSPVVRVLSRPKATVGKSLGLAFAELANGSYGLFVKLKGRWHWHEGDRATMFATVPDEYMEHVIEDIEPKAALRKTLRKSRA